MEVTLKEAALLCKKSEKTLRRKIEAGLLGGRKESLEFGGFMWMIDIDSLEELYPGSRPSQLPALYNSPEPPQVRLKNRPEPESEPELGIAKREDNTRDLNEEDDEDDEDDVAGEWNVRQSFLEYILDENRALKHNLKEKDARILALNERAFVLERALGEQEGTSATQARVLEWFQSQEASREQARQSEESRLLEQAPQPSPTPKTQPWGAALAGAGVTLMVVVALLLSGTL